MKLYPVFLVLLLVLSVGCDNPPMDAKQAILFLGHPYQWAANGERVDHRIEKMDLELFDRIWLGGDVCAKTTEKRSTLNYLDSLFHFASGNTHWALGNHDLEYGNPQFIQETTQRPFHYASWEDGYVLLVLNTNLFSWQDHQPADSVCAEMNSQANLIRMVCDTIQEASHLVVLHHHCLLTNEQTEGTVDLREVFNYYQPRFRVECSKDSSTFSKDLFPEFEKVQERGIQVLLVGGDMGMRAKKFQYQTTSGIWILGAGMNNTVPDFFRPEYITNFDPDQILLLNYQEGAFTWQFQELADPE